MSDSTGFRAAVSDGLCGSEEVVQYIYFNFTMNDGFRKFEGESDTLCLQIYWNVVQLHWQSSCSTIDLSTMISFGLTWQSKLVHPWGMQPNIFSILQNKWEAVGASVFNQWCVTQKSTINLWRRTSFCVRKWEIPSEGKWLSREANTTSSQMWNTYKLMNALWPVKHASWIHKVCLKSFRDSQHLH